MKQNSHVKLTKWEVVNEGAYPIGYYLKGRLLLDIKRGEPICVERYERAAREEGETTPVLCEGLFESSKVVIWSRSDNGQYQIKTENSIWVLEVLDEPLPSFLC